MKIKINEYESYEVNTPENITRQEFLELVSRFNFITKMLGRDNIPTLSQLNNIKRTKKGKIPFNHDRQFLIDCLKLYYNKKLEELNKILIEKGMVWDKARVVRELVKFRKKHNVLPNELGLIEFPSRGR